MRKRDIKIGMAMKHARSGKLLGKVIKINENLIHLDGECPIAYAYELSPADECEPA